MRIFLILISKFRLFISSGLQNFTKTFKKYFYLKILRRKYYRVGKCNCCGRCCKNIYVKHGKTFISDEKLFNSLKPLHPFYFDLEVIGKDEVGLLFACKNLDEATMMCKIHKKRAKICRDYPMEEILKMGGTLAEGCGYRFEPIEKFSDVLGKLDKADRVCKCAKTNALKP